MYDAQQDPEHVAYTDRHHRDEEGNFLFVRATTMVGGKHQSTYHPLEGWEARGMHQNRFVPIFNGGETERDYPPEPWTFTVLKEVVHHADGMNEPAYSYESYAS